MSDIKGDLRDVVISAAKEVEVKNNMRAVIVYFPYRVWVTVKKIQGRLIRELEKKFQKKKVVFVANRTILDLNFRRRGLKVRPRSRTLTAVHDSILEDVVGPTEIVGRRTRITADGTKLMKIFLDPKDKEKADVDTKLTTFAAVYEAHEDLPRSQGQGEGRRRHQADHLRRCVQEADEQGGRVHVSGGVVRPFGSGRIRPRGDRAPGTR